MKNAMAADLVSWLILLPKLVAIFDFERFDDE